MIKVPVGDFVLSKEERDAIIDVLDKGRLSEWEKVKEFENSFARYVGTKYCIAVSSGTAALLVGMLALIYDSRYPKMRNGARIITSPLTYISTSAAIVLSGLIPYYVDIDPNTYGLLPELVEKAIHDEGPDSFAGILPVHLMGFPNQMERLVDAAKNSDLFLFEDSAQAHGTIFNGKRTGSFGHLSAFSFYIAHNIQAGEMGCITTDDEKLYRLIKKLKTNGRICSCDVCTRHEGNCPLSHLSQNTDQDLDPRFTHQYIGYNFKTMEFTAALGITQLKKADMIFNKRLENVRTLNVYLDPYRKWLNLPIYDENVSYLAYPIVLKPECPFPRSVVRKHLEEMGIESRPLFGSIPTQQPAFNHYKMDYLGKLPNADYLGSKGFYIGCHQYISRSMLSLVRDSFEDLFKRVS